MTRFEQSGISRIVHLSSVGAHLSEHTGNILCHYDVEQRLNPSPLSFRQSFN